MIDKKFEVSKVEVKEEVKQEIKDKQELTKMKRETRRTKKENNTKKIFSQDGLLVEILNKLDNIERAVA